MEQRLVLIIESDLNAIGQMRRVLAGLGMRAYAVSDEAALQDLTASLLRGGTPPSLIIARVALPTGSGIRMMEETSAKFPEGRPPPDFAPPACPPHVRSRVQQIRRRLPPRRVHRRPVPRLRRGRNPPLKST